ncbi:Zinc finger protein [Plakobranchus ocellatus]|uniref:Zinc finger protein n=1 Tax=Plakobranchus ocellatus TaxID=259542 RepID=A0AAV4ACE8_9GAST|nr:Zinc finger protein [Plakobranchus ocellatus]
MDPGNRARHGRVRDYCARSLNVWSQSRSSTDEMKCFIKGKIAQGVDAGTIIELVRDQTIITRDTLVDRKDIHRIKNQYGFSFQQKHEDDAASVDLWVDHFRAQEHNPIIFYKQQGEPDESLRTLGFLLCYQSEFQKHMMLEHVNKVFIDSTQNTTQNEGFMLITVSVLDDLQEYVPVAFAIANRGDVVTVKAFFNAIKAYCGGTDIITN